MTKKRDVTVLFYPKAVIETEFEDRYLNVPINLLQGIFENPHEVTQKILIFCMYQLAYDRLKVGTLSERIKMAGKFFSINPEHNAYIMHHGRNLYIDWYANNYPRGGIKVKVLYDFANNIKSEFDLIILCSLIGLKSIIQHDPYKKTTFDALFARMAGFSSAELAEGNIPEVIQKYKSRHYREKIIKALEDHWHLAYEADHTRGFFFSFRMNHEELCHSIQKQRLKKKSIIMEKTRLKHETRLRVRKIYENGVKSDPKFDVDTQLL
jgi:hypothetical protein